MGAKVFVSLIALASSLTISGVAYAAHAAAGRRLAEKWCAKCHNIEKGAPFKLRPPSFASIAVYRPPDDIFSKIVAPHTRMPGINDWMLKSDDMDDIVAYISSLEAK
jgi:mono/diheme cytochrome c family protein